MWISPYLILCKDTKNNWSAQDNHANINIELNRKATKFSFKIQLKMVVDKLIMESGETFEYLVHCLVQFVIERLFNVTVRIVVDIIVRYFQFLFLFWLVVVIPCFILPVPPCSSSSLLGSHYKDMYQGFSCSASLSV